MMKKQNHRKRQNQRSNYKSQPNFLDKLVAYLYIHAQVLISSLGRMADNLFASVMTIMVMAIAMTLALGFYLFVANTQQLTGSLESSNQISLFLKTSVNNKQGQKLAVKLRKNDQLEQVIFISKDKALAEFKEYSGFGEALTIFKTNPLPVVIQIIPKNTLNDLENIHNLMAEFKQLPQLDFAQMDMKWVERVQSMVKIIQRGVYLITVLLAVAVLFITGNSIRLELQHRRDEVIIAKLVGATNAFIQRPFIYTGFWLGFLAGMFALISVSMMLLVLQAPIERLSILYDSGFEIQYLGLIDTFLLLLMASLLGVIVAWIVLYYQLKDIKPE